MDHAEKTLPEASKRKAKAAAPTSNTEMGLCPHFVRFEEDMVRFVSKLRSSERAPRCEHYLCENKVEKSSILVCIDCNLHFCIGSGTKNSPQGHARWHAELEQHPVGAFSSEPQTLYCFICERRLELEVNEMQCECDIKSDNSNSNSTDSCGCGHFLLDEEEINLIVSEVMASKNALACQHPGCKITGRTRIMVCTGCNKHFCTRAKAKKRPLGHARQHAKKCEHWVGLWCSNLCLGYCFMCEFELTLGTRNFDVGMMFGKEAFGRAFGSKKEHVCPIRGMPNLGNTCYMNALLQCLFVLGKLRARMLAPDAPSDMLGVALKDLFEEVNNVNNARHQLNPTKFFSCLCILDARYAGSDMQDSHELLCLILDRLVEEEKLNMAAVIPTVVDSIFRSHISVTMSCTCCSYSSPSCEVTYDISLPLPLERPPPKSIALPPRNISCMSQEKTGTKLFPEDDMSNTEHIQAIAAGRDSHVTGLEPRDVAVEKISEPLEVDSIEVEHSSRTKDGLCVPSQTQKDNVPGEIVQVPTKAGDLGQNDNTGLGNTSSEPEVSIKDKKNTCSVEGAAEDKRKSQGRNIDHGKTEANNSLASIEECLALHFKAELLEWNCEKCSKAAQHPSTTNSKDTKQTMASTNENTVDGDQTVQSDKIACQSQQSRNLDTSALECSSKQPHGSDSQRQAMPTADSITKGISTSPPAKHMYTLCSQGPLSSHNRVTSGMTYGEQQFASDNDIKTEGHEGVQEAGPSCLPTEEPVNQLSVQGQNASTADQGEGKQVKLDHNAGQVDANQSKREDRIQGGIQTRLISKLPPVLAIHLKRSLCTGKVRGHVSFEEILDVAQFMEPSSEDKHNSSYRLVGVIEHLGPRTSAGHWIAYVRQNREQPDSGSSSWYCADDINIKEVSLEEVLKCEAQLLFYERMDG
uniref:Ubiquitinyl hydrolase 1 n=2 Tax=Oryza brachyantha TaxID=4533 RepID=J3MUM1_ORYBR